MLSRTVAYRSRQQQHAYLRALRESVPRQPTSQGSAVGVTQQALHHLGPLRHDVHGLSVVQKNAKHLNLPEEWIPGATAALQSGFHGILSPESVRRNELLLAALIHPSYVSHRGARQATAMPAETMLLGTALLRLVQEISQCHTRPGGAAVSPACTPAFLASIPRLLGVETFILYNAAVVASHTRGGADKLNVPDEVLLGSATALCGAVSAVEGMDCAIAFLDELSTQRKVDHAAV